MSEHPQRRRGDARPIRGDYQHRARTAGFVVQRFWHAEKVRMVNKYGQFGGDDMVLDVGCGSGVVSAALSAKAGFVLGVDGSHQAVEYASRVFVEENLLFVRAHADELPFKDGAFTGAVCLEVLEHLYHHQSLKLLRECRRVIRPGGALLLSTPNYRGIWPILETILDAARIVPRLSGDQHVSKHSLNTLRTALNEVGWRLTDATTFSTVAPFASVFGWSVAEWIANAEDEWALPFGCIAFIRAERLS